jgi:hypothetical protein
MDANRESPIAYSSGLSEEPRGAWGRAVRCTVRFVGRKGLRKLACKNPFVRRTSTCRRQARALRLPSNHTPARSASAGAISGDIRRSPGVMPFGSRIRGIYRAATLAAWLPRHP